MQINSNYPSFIANGHLLRMEDLQEYPMNGPMIYEVIRLIDGKPLFYKEHMERLCESAEHLGKSITSLLESIHHGVNVLIAKNAIQSDNIKIVIGSLDQAKFEWVIFGVKGFYPPVLWFEKGIKTTIISVSRENPHAKVINDSLAKKVDALRQSTDIFEALLVDEKGRITEGSRSNVFFIKEDRLLMPKTDLALKGITRLKLLALLEKLGIDCREEDIFVSDLDTVQGVFITGTSIDLLPISAIDDYSYQTSQLPIMKQLLTEYRQLMKDSLSQYNQE